MTWWQKNRRILAPLSAAVLAAVLYGPAGAGMFWSIVAFFFFWIIAARLLRPDPYAALFDQAEGLLVDPKLLAQELRVAEGRLRTIRRNSFRLNDRDIRQTVGVISGSAKQMIREVKANPAEFPRVQKALGSYLGHLETVTGSLLTLQREGEDSQALTDRTRQTLDELAETFDKYRRKMVDDDRLELDVRLELLERSMQRDGLKRAATDLNRRS
ncbi:MAG: 5-bromo-4-chloroindolyl phosphate hydrolysis family protein [Pseudomonadota bacterium]